MAHRVYVKVLDPFCAARFCLIFSLYLDISSIFRPILTIV